MNPTVCTDLVFNMFMYISVATVQHVSPGPVLSGLSEVSVLEQVSSPCELDKQILQRRKHPH